MDAFWDPHKIKIAIVACDNEPLKSKYEESLNSLYGAQNCLKFCFLKDYLFKWDHIMNLKTYIPNQETNYSQ